MHALHRASFETPTPADGKHHEDFYYLLLMEISISNKYCNRNLMFTISVKHAHAGN